MQNIIAEYQTIQHNFNQKVSSKYQLPLQVPVDGDKRLVAHDPIQIDMSFQQQNVVSIMIHSDDANHPAWAEVFEGFEQGMGWSSIKFFNAYQSSIQEHRTVIAVAHGIQAVHTPLPNNGLRVVLTRVGDDDVI